MRNWKIGLLSVALVSGLLSCKKKEEITAPPPPPVVTIADGQQTRTTTAATLRFTVTLSKAITTAASVDYTLEDGTAVSPHDYTKSSGTVTIAANQTQGTIEVQIAADPNNTRQDNLQFTAKLSNAKSCAIGIASAKGTIITQDGINMITDNTGYTTPLTYPGYALAWNDEFSGASLDLGTWNTEIGNANGWGNHELEYYTSSSKNVFLSNGNLIIEARKEPTSGFDYSSARLTTQGKKTFKFGRIDIRAKLPVGKGIWPALWMLGANIPTVPWPGCGEMDIMELVGPFPSRYYTTMHWQAANGSHASKGDVFNLPSGDFSDQFHVFSLVWSQDLIKSYLDDQLVLTTTAGDVGAGNYPFNNPEFFIFNVAVGGDFPGPPDASSFPPQRMFVDYVRVFQ